VNKKPRCQDVILTGTYRSVSEHWPSTLPTSIFIFDKFVDGAQPEVAGEIAGRWHILRTLLLVSHSSTSDMRVMFG
jgi:hypothetical protein